MKFAAWLNSVSAQSPPAFGTAMHQKAPISGGTVFHFLKTDSA
jgi:hypothetical protein